jgi:hypothetical protein
VQIAQQCMDIVARGHDKHEMISPPDPRPVPRAWQKRYRE